MRQLTRQPLSSPLWSTVDVFFKAYDGLFAPSIPVRCWCILPKVISYMMTKIICNTLKSVHDVVNWAPRPKLNSRVQWSNFEQQRDPEGEAIRTLCAKVGETLPSRGVPRRRQCVGSPLHGGKESTVEAFVIFNKVIGQSLRPRAWGEEPRTRPRNSHTLFITGESYLLHNACLLKMSQFHAYKSRNFFSDRIRGARSSSVFVCLPLRKKKIEISVAYRILAMHAIPDFDLDDLIFSSSTSSSTASTPDLESSLSSADWLTGNSVTSFSSSWPVEQKINLDEASSTKIRRKLARSERRRSVQRLMDGYALLRAHLPPHLRTRKLTRVEIVKHAANYIQGLRDLLASADDGQRVAEPSIHVQRVHSLRETSTRAEITRTSEPQSIVSHRELLEVALPPTSSTSRPQRTGFDGKQSFLPDQSISSMTTNAITNQQLTCSRGETFPSVREPANEFPNEHFTDLFGSLDDFLLMLELTT